MSSSEYLFFHEVSFVIYVVGSFVWALIHTPLFYATKVCHQFYVQESRDRRQEEGEERGKQRRGRKEL